MAACIMWVDWRKTRHSRVQVSQSGHNVDLGWLAMAPLSYLDYFPIIDVWTFVMVEMQHRNERSRGRPFNALSFIWHLDTLNGKEKFWNQGLLASTSCNQLLYPQTKAVRLRNHIFCLFWGTTIVVTEVTSNTWRKVSSLSRKLLWRAKHDECVTREWCLLCLLRLMAKP